jgi:hypothetical protein
VRLALALLLACLALCTEAAAYTFPSGSTAIPRSESYCASIAPTTSWEPRPGNYVANHTVPSGPVAWRSTPDQTYWTKWIAERNHVDGLFTGTTNQIITWAACKWGIDVNTVRAVAVQESDWHQSALGDVCGPVGEASYGILQIKNLNCARDDGWGGYPDTQNETALNVDFYAAYIRSCYDGDFYDGGAWLYGGKTVQQIAAARGWDYVLWGCIGSWYSGGWYDQGAQDYIALVKQWLAARTWLSY